MLKKKDQSEKHHKKIEEMIKRLNKQKEKIFKLEQSLNKSLASISEKIDFLRN